MIIDLRSDTATRPTKGMLEAMWGAEVGDDVFGEDPTVNKLEEKAAGMFNMEAALFCPSGTMTNQIGIKTHVQAGDEIIIDRTAHIYNFEGGGIAFHAGASVRTIDGDRGRITPQDILDNINPPGDHYPKTALVTIENTSNKAGGSYYTLEEMQAISKVCRDEQLKIHLDGARIFNALVEIEHDPAELGGLFDSISFCLSKGLGAPVGSLLLGSKEYIKRARRIRKVMGGGMRQGGYLAAAGIYALTHHIKRLKEDHRRAKELGEGLKTLSYVSELLPIDTNIIVFKLIESCKREDFIGKLLKKDIKVVPFGPQTIRMVTHLDFDDEMLEKVLRVLKSL